MRAATSSESSRPPAISSARERMPTAFTGDVPASCSSDIDCRNPTSAVCRCRIRYRTASEPGAESTRNASVRADTSLPGRADARGVDQREPFEPAVRGLDDELVDLVDGQGAEVDAGLPTGADERHLHRLRADRVGPGARRRTVEVAGDDAGALGRVGGGQPLADERVEQRGLAGLHPPGERDPQRTVQAVEHVLQLVRLGQPLVGVAGVGEQGTDRRGRRAAHAGTGSRSVSRAPTSRCRVRSASSSESSSARRVARVSSSPVERRGQRLGGPGGRGEQLARAGGERLAQAALQPADRVAGVLAGGGVDLLEVRRRRRGRCRRAALAAAPSGRSARTCRPGRWTGRERRAGRPGTRGRAPGRRRA